MGKSVNLKLISFTFTAMLHIWWCRFFLDFLSKSQLIMSDKTRASSRIRTRLVVKNWKADLLLKALFQSFSSFWFILFIIFSTSSCWAPPKVSKDHFSPWSLSIFAYKALANYCSPSKILTPIIQFTLQYHWKNKFGPKTFYF